ncbi:uncharacterized protein N7477_009874, partial [Penicillium maclennaniae]|uniref:uncharacterized protein n=1 Tax=Penicillium maclennaniae TaxID=1343394 RepID=UPI002540B412
TQSYHLYLTAGRRPFIRRLWLSLGISLINSGNIGRSYSVSNPSRILAITTDNALNNKTMFDKV